MLIGPIQNDRPSVLSAYKHKKVRKKERQKSEIKKINIIQNDKHRVERILDTCIQQKSISITYIYVRILPLT